MYDDFLKIRPINLCFGFTPPLFIVMKAKSAKRVFPEKTHEPLNGGGASDMERRKGRPYSRTKGLAVIYLLRRVQKATPPFLSKWCLDLILRVFYSLRLSPSLLWPVVC